MKPSRSARDGRRPPSGPARRGGPVKAAPAALDRAMPARRAGAAVMRSSLAHLRANERGMLAGTDPEYLHQMRVALRRLRSALGVFEPVLGEGEVSALRGELKWLAARLGPARDWDVFMDETLPPIEAEFGPHPGLDRLAARCRTLRGAAAANARRAVRSARYERLASRLKAWLDAEGRQPPAGAASGAPDAPVTEFASAVLERRYGQVRSRGRAIARLDPARLHRLRIAIKKFRYPLDFFAGLYEGKAARAALRRLSRLQDILGAMNDAATAGTLLSRSGIGPGRAALEAKGLLLGWSRARAATLRRELKAAWKEFLAVEKFW